MALSKGQKRKSLSVNNMDIYAICLGIYIFSVSNMENSYSFFNIINLVNRSIIARTNSPSITSNKFLATYRPRLGRQRKQGVTHSLIVAFRK